jgi:hypothetical protein
MPPRGANTTAFAAPGSGPRDISCLTRNRPPPEPLPQLSQPADKKRVPRYAEELDEQAARLEKQAADMRGPTLV